MGDKERKHQFISDALNERVSKHQLRSLHNIKPAQNRTSIIVEGKRYINFSSNDYLGLSTHPALIERSNEFAQKYGTGSGASRLVTGTLHIHSGLEQKLAEVFGSETALLFNSGFQANTSILPAVANRHSLILADKKIHNSLIQGALLSRAVFQRYEHNDYEHLESLLKEAAGRYNRIWIVSETIFSMDGDRSDLDKLIFLSKKYDALLYSDDAHALGVLGDKGLGLNYGRQGIDISLGTFGKAFGAFGAFVCCSSKMREYLINFSGGFIYSTALPPAVIGSVDAALDLILVMNTEREELLLNCNYLKKELKLIGFGTLNSESQIIPVMIGNEEEALRLSDKLKQHGFWVTAIRPPTVQSNASRLRITLSVHHERNQIDNLLGVLSEWKRM